MTIEICLLMKKIELTCWLATLWKKNSTTSTTTTLTAGRCTYYQWSCPCHHAQWTRTSTCDAHGTVARISHSCNSDRGNGNPRTSHRGNRKHRRHPPGTGPCRRTCFFVRWSAHNISATFSSVHALTFLDWSCWGNRPLRWVCGFDVRLHPTLGSDCRKMWTRWSRLRTDCIVRRSRRRCAGETRMPI